MDLGASMLRPYPEVLLMNNSTLMSLPFTTALIILSSNSSFVLAGDAFVPQPPVLRTASFTQSSETTTLRFTPVPYRRSVQTDAPIRVASLPVEKTVRTADARHAAIDLPSGLVEQIGNQIQKRIEEYQASQPMDLMVPLPRGIDPALESVTSVGNSTVAVKPDSYTQPKAPRTRMPIDFYSTVGQRSLY